MSRWRQKTPKRRMAPAHIPEDPGFQIAPALRRHGMVAGLRTGASTLVLGAMASISASGPLFAQTAAPVAPNNIVIDGRTNTLVTVQGNQTAITTSTVSKNTGFNSFQTFEEGIGNTVNLYLPAGTSNLVNMVHNGSVVVNGVLNAYKDGQIGGNVYFADPNGFIVGQSGVINVGALTVNTPTGKFLEGVIGPDGSVNDAAAGQLMRGDIPLSPNGFISISGVINAKDGITLDGQSVSVPGPSGTPISGKDLTQRQKFKATVNTAGLTEGGALVSRNGVISIVAAGDVAIGGRIKVGATKGAGGKIKVASGGKTTISASAKLSANGAGKNGAGGSISVKAATTLNAMAGAAISARGAGTGTGGFVELSGHVANIGAVSVDLGSDSGASGTLLFDPYDLVIGGVTTSGASSDPTISMANSITSNGATVILQADHSITVASGGVIDTTRTGGNAGDITLEAPSITLSDGSVLKADASGGFTAGTIKLDAEQTAGGTAQIVIGTGTGTAPIVTGGDIILIASSTATAPTILASTPTAHASITIDGAHITASGDLNATATAATATSASLLPIGVVVTDVAASVDIIGASVIHAASAELVANSTAEAEIATQSLVPHSAAADGAVAISTVTSSATTHIGDTADLTVTGALAMEATNTVVSHADATPIAAAFGASVAVSVVKVTTSSTIDGAASIDAGALSLAATTATDIEVTAAAAAGGASAPQSGSEASTYLSDPDYAPYEKTSEGKVSVVGALALSDLKSSTTTSMASSSAATVTNALALTSKTTNTVAVTADGSAVDSKVGVGVALGINLGSVRNDALITQAVSAASLSLDALMNGAAGHNSFTTSATSGAGGTNVGIAGSLAVNLVDTESVASLGTGAAVTITGHGAVNLGSEDDSVSSASAVPDTSGGHRQGRHRRLGRLEHRRQPHHVRRRRRRRRHRGGRPDPFRQRGPRDHHRGCGRRHRRHRHHPGPRSGAGEQHHDRAAGHRRHAAGRWRRADRRQPAGDRDHNRLRQGGRWQGRNRRRAGAQPGE